MAFIKKLDDKVAKWQSSRVCNWLIYRHFVNFATLPSYFSPSITVGFDPTSLILHFSRIFARTATSSVRSDVI